MRYPEVLLRLFVIRLRYRPHTYILTFRGYEILPFVRLLTLGKTLIFDEFINLVEWVTYEHKKIKENSLADRIMRTFYRTALKSTGLVLSDTKKHAEYSSSLMKIDIKKYSSLPVGADESVFFPSQGKKRRRSGDFIVFFYGNMLPLHGIKYICEAAEDIGRSQKNIIFRIIGVDKKTEQIMKDSVKRGANIQYEGRVSISELKRNIDESDLCLGGPFGDTLQSQMVVTGKTYQFLACQKATIIGENEVTSAKNSPFLNEKNCLVVKQGDSKELAAKILWAFNNKGSIANIASEGRSLYEDYFSTKKISQVLGGLLQ